MGREDTQARDNDIRAQTVEELRDSKREYAGEIPSGVRHIRDRSATVGRRLISAAELPEASSSVVPFIATLGALPVLFVLGRLYLYCRHGYKFQRHRDTRD